MLRRAAGRVKLGRLLGQWPPSRNLGRELGGTVEGAGSATITTLEG
jgi:hypothetical protein